MFEFAFGLIKEAKQKAFWTQAQGKGLPRSPWSGEAHWVDENYKWFQNTHAQKGNKKTINVSKSTNDLLSDGLGSRLKRHETRISDHKQS